ncbi:hypothetical protein MauCBS54593_006910 [Microsporum audouinii]
MLQSLPLPISLLAFTALISKFKQQPPDTGMSYANFDGLDLATASLIVQLQLDDIQEIRGHSKGKSREGEVSDTDLSLKLYDDELVQRSQILRDTLATRSIAAAIRNDQLAIQNCVEGERRTYQDRQLAYRLGGIKPPQAPVLAICSGKQTNKAAEQSSSSSPISLYKEASEEVLECEICCEAVDITGSARLPCNHLYCRRCLQRLFHESLSDETLFPPRCCRQQIIVEQVGGLLTPDLIASFKERKIEFDTKDRTYCSSPSCSKFIRPEHIEGERALCPHCDTTTCTICKFGTHDGDCPKDTALSQVLALAKTTGWQRCYSCKRIIELDTGCYHITSVISVVSTGKSVPVSFGMKISWFGVQINSSTAGRGLRKTVRWQLQDKSVIYESGITVAMKGGLGWKADIAVRNAETHCPILSWNVANVSSRPAFDAGGIDYNAAH